MSLGGRESRDLLKGNVVISSLFLYLEYPSKGYEKEITVLFL